jgi:lipopolysaccharide transport system ATP-binding protein
VDDALQLSKISKTYFLWKSPSKRFLLPVIERLYGLLPLERIGFPALEKLKLKHRTVFHALHEMDLSVRKGECFGIIGRNGSGKSTLLQIMSQILTPTEGSILTDGKVAALLELGSGFNPEFTGRENVYLNAAIYGLTKSQVDPLLEKIEAFAEIGEFIDHKVKQYSSGMVVRLAFSVLVHLKPDILIIDEALAVGDSFFVQKCMRWLQEFKKKKTVILVSHDLSAITRFCDRVGWLDEGRIKYLGHPKRATELYLESHYQQVSDVSDGDELEASNFSDRGDIAPEDFRQNELREDGRIEIPVLNCFNESSSFGENKVLISKVYLRDLGSKQKRSKNLIRGGELVEVNITIKAQEEVFSPIVGFGLKNRHGQELFHDNTYLTSYLTGQEPLRLKAGDSAQATFVFVMPYLPPGEYFLFSAVATGSHEEHTQQHWIHDAIKLTSACSRICLGLVGLPMQNVEFYKMEDD